MKLSLRELGKELDRLNWIESDPRVRAAKELVRKEREPKIAEIKAQMEALRAERPERKPRWPENIPANVLKVCQDYWTGTTEYSTFRIHCWNDKIVCTSYPSGGYSNALGRQATPAVFHFISLKEKEYAKPKIIGVDLSGRQNQNKLEAELAERTK